MYLFGLDIAVILKKLTSDQVNEVVKTVSQCLVPKKS